MSKDNRMNWIAKRLIAYFFSDEDPRNLAICRVIFFLLMGFAYLKVDFVRFAYAPVELYEPVWLLKVVRAPVLSPYEMGLAAWLWKGSLFCAAIGFATRISTVTAFVLGAYLLGFPHSFSTTCHYDAVMVLIMGVLAVAKCGDVFSVDCWMKRKFSFKQPDGLSRSPEYSWPIRLICVFIVLSYFAAGISKLRNSGFHWFTSDYLSHLLILHQYIAYPPTRLGLALAKYQWLCSIMAFSSIVLEVSSPLALFSRRFFWAWILCVYWMHIGIYFLLGPDFSLNIFGYVFFIPWTHLADYISRQRIQSVDLK